MLVFSVGGEMGCQVLLEGRELGTPFLHGIVAVYIWSIWNTSIPLALLSIFLKIYPSEIIRWYIKTIPYFLHNGILEMLVKVNVLRLKNTLLKRKIRFLIMHFLYTQSLMICISSVLFMFFNLVLCSDDWIPVNGLSSASRWLWLEISCIQNAESFLSLCQL